jgi:hypothetical protein
VQLLHNSALFSMELSVARDKARDRYWPVAAVAHGASLNVRLQHAPRVRTTFPKVLSGLTRLVKPSYAAICHQRSGLTGGGSVRGTDNDIASRVRR